MSSLTSGGTDWTDNTITGLRLDFDLSAYSVFDIDSVIVGKYGDSFQWDSIIGEGKALVESQAAGAYSLTSAWTKPGYTLIDGNQIYTGDAYVDTLQIAGNACTVPTSSYIASTSTGYVNYLYVGGLTIECIAGVPTQVHFSTYITTTYQQNLNVQFTVNKNGTNIMTIMGNNWRTTSFVYVETGGGTNTYEVYAYIGNIGLTGSINAYHSSLYSLTCKR